MTIGRRLENTSFNAGSEPSAMRLSVASRSFRSVIVLAIEYVNLWLVRSVLLKRMSERRWIVLVHRLFCTAMYSSSFLEYAAKLVSEAADKNNGCFAVIVGRCCSDPSESVIASRRATTALLPAAP